MEIWHLALPSLLLSLGLSPSFLVVWLYSPLPRVRNVNVVNPHSLNCRLFVSNAMLFVPWLLAKSGNCNDDLQVGVGWYRNLPYLSPRFPPCKVTCIGYIEVRYARYMSSLLNTGIDYLSDSFFISWDRRAWPPPLPPPPPKAIDRVYERQLPEF